MEIIEFFKLAIESYFKLWLIPFDFGNGNVFSKWDIVVFGVVLVIILKILFISFKGAEIKKKGE